MQTGITLTAEKIYELAEKNNISVTNYWEPSSDGRNPPRLREIMLRFNEERPLAWATLMANPSEVPVSIMGTRRSTLSGATDGTFYPSYAALLPEVNQYREALGLERVRN